MNSALNILRHSFVILLFFIGLFEGSVIGESVRSEGYSTSFENVSTGELIRLELGKGTWSGESGHVAITGRFAHQGRQALHLLGGENRTVVLSLSEEVSAGSVLRFQAERWTSKDPYAFRVEAKVGDRWSEVYRGDRKILVGSRFKSNVECSLPTRTTALRFVSSAPARSGTLVDDVSIRVPGPMRLLEVVSNQAVVPVLIGKRDNPVFQFTVRTDGNLAPKTVRSVTLGTRGTTEMADVAAVRVFLGGQLVGESKAGTDVMTVFGEATLEEGENVFQVMVELEPDADMDHVVDARLIHVDVDGRIHRPSSESRTGSQRIGVAVRTAGQDDCHTYRIPGLATTLRGTLIAVYDNRYRGSGDLPGDIDVGMSRSTDGGRSWEPMKVVIDMGGDEKWRYDGVGDPSVLVDRVTGRIWVSGTWSHGNRSWNGSGPGLTPDETGQFLLVYSDDDGVSWSEPRNITRQIKKPEWRFVLQGPGSGITMKDGTLVFPAQFRGENAPPIGGKPFSTLIYSKDRGQTWAIGTGVKIDTTEAQLVELADGSIMINCRDNRNRGLPDGQNGRTVAVTRDLGQTWKLHPTDRKALPEPTCMASLMRFEREKGDDLLLFSNPATGTGRFNMTLKVSDDEGMTWPKRWHTLYDARRSAGYSCLAQIDENHAGVLYEGVRELYFLRFKIADLLKED